MFDDERRSARTPRTPPHHLGKGPQSINTTDTRNRSGSWRLRRCVRLRRGDPGAAEHRALGGCATEPVAHIAFDAAAVAAYVGAIDGPVVPLGIPTAARSSPRPPRTWTMSPAWFIWPRSAWTLVRAAPACNSRSRRRCWPAPPTRPATRRSEHQGPDLYINKERFRETFCADAPADTAEVMYATQRPLSLAALTENATAAG